MPSIIHNLPGISTPVSAISHTLREMWQSDPGTIDSPPSDFRASQLNLVIHLGEQTTTGEAWPFLPPAFTSDNATLAGS